MRARDARRSARSAVLDDLLTAFGLVLVLEGTFLALFPHRLRQILAMMEQVPPEALRVGGLVAVALGAVLVWLIRG